MHIMEEKQLCEVIELFKEEYIRYIVASVNIILALIATSGNAIICLAIFKSEYLRSMAPTLFIISLAIADLLVGAVVEPLYSIMLFDWSTKTCFLENCKLCLGFFTCSISICSAICVCMDRMIIICKPFKYDIYVTKTRVIIAVIFTWLSGGFIGYISVFMEDKKLVAFGTMAWVLTSTLIGLFSSVKIYKVGRRQIKDICDLSGKKSILRERKLALSLFLVLGAILICWFPFVVVNCCIQYLYTEKTWKAFFLVRTCTITFGYANSSINIFIFSFKNREIRKAIKNLLGIKKIHDSSHFESSKQSSITTTSSYMSEYRRCSNITLRDYGSMKSDVIANPFVVESALNQLKLP